MTLPLKFWFFEPLGHLPRKARNPRTWLSTFLPPVYCVTLSLNAAQYPIATRANLNNEDWPLDPDSESFSVPGALDATFSAWKINPSEERSWTSKSHGYKHDTEQEKASAGGWIKKAQFELRGNQPFGLPDRASSKAK